MQTVDFTFLSTDQVSVLLGLSRSTLAKWRLSGAGPNYSKLGRRVVYRRSEIEKWMDANAYSSTSEYPDDLQGREG